MTFGLEQHIIDKIISAFEANAKVDKAYVFGSRAKGNYRPDSDIDIAIKGIDITLDDILKMSVAFEDKGIKNKIDLIDYTSIKEPALQEHIDRVGIEFYSRWKDYKLEEITEPIKDTYNPNGSDDYTYIGLEHIEQESLRLNSVGLSSDVTSNKFKFQADDVLFGKLRPYFRKVVKPQFNGICSTDIWVFRAKRGFDQNFLFYFLANKEFVDTANSGESGSRMPRADWNHLKTTDWSVPPLPEQITISSILSSLDDKIDLLQRQNKTLEQLAETLFRQWFVEEAEESWEEKKLGELLTITSSKRIFYSEYVSSGVPFYRSKEIIELRNTGSTNSELYIPNERFDEINNKFGSPKEGDILMTSVGTLGVAYRVRKTDKFYFKDGNLTWFKDFKGLPSSIVYLWLISKIGQEELAAITIGSTQEALTIEGLKSISFKIPPKESIKLYETEFNTIINKIEFNQTQIRTLTQTRDTLLPKLMSGEVRVNM